MPLFRSKAEAKVRDAGYDPARLPPGQYFTEKWPVLHAGDVPRVDLAAWTLRIWGDSLESNRDKAIEVTSEEVYNRYMKYLRGCRDFFADECLDCSLVTYLKPGAAA